MNTPRSTPARARAIVVVPTPPATPATVRARRVAASFTSPPLVSCRGRRPVLVRGACSPRAHAFSCAEDAVRTVCARGTHDVRTLRRWASATRDASARVRACGARVCEHATVHSLDEPARAGESARHRDSGGSDGLGSWHRLPTGAATRRLPRLRAGRRHRHRRHPATRQRGGDRLARGMRLRVARRPVLPPRRMAQRHRRCAGRGRGLGRRHGHLRRMGPPRPTAVPELSIYELARHLADIQRHAERCRDRSGRRAGLSWAQIAQSGRH